MSETLNAVAGLSIAGLRRIDAKIAGFIAQGQLPGVATLVARHGQVVHRSTQGLKDIASGEPLAEDTIYRIYSMTKPVTAVAMMLLHDQGLWSPDDRIAKHLSEFADVQGPSGGAPAHAPTMDELMTHTAGFGYGIGMGPHDATDTAYLDAGVWKASDLAEFSRRVAAIPLAYEPGSAWRYSLSMDLQGAIIERLSGQSLPEFMRTRIFQPLGMTDTDFYVPAGKRPRLASLYHMYGQSELAVLDHPGFVRDPKVIPPIPSGGGGLFSTITDYARFAQMLLNKGELNGTRILSPEAVATMTANHLPQAILDRGVVAGAQKIGPGRGYAYNGAVFFDPAAAGSPVGRGTYQWDGASSVWFWIDPENDLLFVGMVQRMMQEGMPPLQGLTQSMIAEALQAADGPSS
jgi:CubicO group peptidase (beta-lactamase class C family)